MRATTAAKTKEKAAAPPPATAATMSFARYAQHQDVSTATIRAWRAKGLLVEVSRGRIDVIASDASLAARNPRGVKAGVLAASSEPVEHPHGGFSTAEAQRRRANLDLQQREIEVAARAGQYCEMTVAIDAIAEQLRLVKARLLEIPAAVAPRLVANASAADIQFVLHNAVTRALEDLVGLARDDIVRLQNKDKR